MVNLTKPEQKLVINGGVMKEKVNIFGGPKQFVSENKKRLVSI